MESSEEQSLFIHTGGNTGDIHVARITDETGQMKQGTDNNFKYKTK